MPFRFQSVIRLKKELGEYDAIVQVNEVAIRDFIENGLKSGSLDNYIETQSTKYGIKTSNVKTALISQRLSLKYISSVQQYAEYFFHLFRKEYQELFITEINIGDTEGALLDKILSNLPYDKEELLTSVGEIEYMLISYYRKVRNYYSHYFKAKHRHLEPDYHALKARKTEILKKYKIENAPNRYNELNFNDFMLFTRALKYFSQNLCDYISPEDDVFVDYLKAIKFKKHLISNKKRYRMSVASYLRVKYGIGSMQSENIFNALIA